MNNLSDEKFLDYMAAAGEQQYLVNKPQVDRFRKLANWADTDLPLRWTGTVDANEIKRGVEDARKRLKASA